MMIFDDSLGERPSENPDDSRSIELSDDDCE